MRVADPIALSPEEKKMLTEISRSQKTSVRLAQRAKIILLAAEGMQNIEIGGELGISRFKVSRWRVRYRQFGLSGIEKDAPRSGREPKLPATKRKEIVRITLQQKPENATHWSCRRMAAKAGVSAATVGRIWREHGIKPHRVKTFKLSNPAILILNSESRRSLE
jgi:transposase